MIRYVRRPDVEAAPMLEETVLYSPSVKRFCVLNPTAALVWDRLVEPRTAESLAADLLDRFAVTAGVNVDADVRAALEQLEGLDLVTQVREA